MANKWMRKLGFGMAMIMTVSQMSGMVTLAAPEEEWVEEDYCDIWEEDNADDQSIITDDTEIVYAQDDGIYTASDIAIGSDTVTLDLEITFDQSGARDMLEMVNAFRVNDGTWTDQDGNTQTNKQSEIKYGEVAEEYAMQRAAEIMLLYDGHSRPDGRSSATVTEIHDVAYDALGENIVVGTNGRNSTAQEAFESWREDDYGYSGQIHRRNMLSVPNGKDVNYDSIGIAHAVAYNEKGRVDVWVQEFGLSFRDDHTDTLYSDISEMSSPLDGKKNIPVTFSTDCVVSERLIWGYKEESSKWQTLSYEDVNGQLDIKAGETKEMPLMYHLFKVGSEDETDSLFASMLNHDLEWVAEICCNKDNFDNSVIDTSIAKFDGDGNVKGIAGGTTVADLSRKVDSLSGGDDLTCDGLTINIKGNGSETPTPSPEDPTPTTEPEDPTPTTEPEDPTPTTEPEDPTPTTEPEDPTPTTNTYKRGVDGEISWSLDNGDLYITGCGYSPEGYNMKSYDSFMDTPWAEYKDEIRNIHVSGALNIGANAFSDCTNLERVSLGELYVNSLKTIETGAFRNCKSLESFIVPHSVTRIENEAFFGCTALKEIYLSKNVEEIGKSAFSCENGDLSKMSLCDVYYNGSSDEWESFAQKSIKEDNELLTKNSNYSDYKANIYFDIRYNFAPEITKVRYKNGGIEIIWKKRQFENEYGHYVDVDHYNIYMNHHGNMSVEEQSKQMTPEWILVGKANGTDDVFTFLEADSIQIGDIYSFRISGEYENEQSLLSDYYSFTMTAEYTEEPWYEDFAYTISENKLIITEYIGEDDNLTIPADAIINGENYGVEVDSLYKLPGWNYYLYKFHNANYDFNNIPPLKRIIFEDGVVFSQHMTFAGLESLEELDLSGVNTSKMYDMSFMFYKCSNLKNIDLSCFDTSNVGDMQYMFAGCRNLEQLDLSGFDTHNVSGEESTFMMKPNWYITSYFGGMASMFSGCENLKTLNLHSFDTSSVYTMADMFKDCKSLNTIDMSSFDLGAIKYGINNIMEGSGVETVYTPRNLTSEEISIKSESVFVDTSSGKEYTCFPYGEDSLESHKFIQKNSDTPEDSGISNTFSLQDAENGITAYDEQHTLKLETNENGNFVAAQILNADGNADANVGSYIANIVTEYDEEGNPKVFYSLVFRNGVWDTSYDSGTMGAFAYKGIDYFVAGGVVNQNANGLIYTGNDGWKFLAAGHVVTDNAGLVMYNGDWFWIDDKGSCDDTYAAIVKWNGADFLVHGGRLRTDYTGFTYDPQNTDIWYHITAGQVWGDGEITDISIEGGEITRNVVAGVVQPESVQ